MPTTLAIVIPAYKTKYLAQALNSIACQTNKAFKVYVSDDGSRDDIKTIVARYTDGLNIHYYRFEDNMGSTNLAGHWNRSIALVNEEWIWLFSDDDIMEPGCVQAFYDTLNNTTNQFELYRFNIEMIDADNEVICVKQPHPQTETAYQFLVRRLQSKSLSAAIEYVFSKSVFEQYNGFEQFPMAYCADDATWIKFAGDTTIYTMADAKVYWRASGINISSAKLHAYKKASALIQFVGFIIDKFRDRKAELLTLAEPWFYENLNYINGKLSLGESLKLWRSFTRIFITNKTGALKKIILSQLRNTRVAGKL